MRSLAERLRLKIQEIKQNPKEYSSFFMAFALLFNFGIVVFGYSNANCNNNLNYNLFVEVGKDLHAIDARLAYEVNLTENINHTKCPQKKVYMDIYNKDIFDVGKLITADNQTMDTRNIFNFSQNISEIFSILSIIGALTLSFFAIPQQCPPSIRKKSDEGTQPKEEPQQQEKNWDEDALQSYGDIT